MKHILRLSLILTFLMVLLVPTGAFALSKNFSTTVNGTFQYFWNWGAEYASAVGASQSSNWTDGLINPNVTVTYEADVLDNTTGALIPNNSTIPVGTKLRFAPKDFEDTDIYWFGTGKSADSPYGHWVSGADFPAGSISCPQQDYVSTYIYPTPKVGPIKVYVPLSVNPPQVTISHSGTADLSCNSGNTVCTVNSAGTIDSSFIFEPTIGKFYYRYDDPQIKSRLTLYGTGQLLKINLRDPQCVGNEVPLRLGSATAQNVYTIPRSEQDLEQRIQKAGGGTYRFYDEDNEEQLQFRSSRFENRRIGFGGAQQNSSQPTFSSFIAAVFAPFSNGSFAVGDRFDPFDFTFETTVRTPTPTQEVSPALPTISGATSGDIDIEYSFQLSPGNFRDLRPIAYEIDWNGDSVVNQRTPTTGFVVPSSFQTVSKSWNSFGPKTFKVRSVVSGFTSNWKTYTINIVTPQQVIINVSSTNTTNSDDGTYVLDVPEVVITSNLNATGGNTPPSAPIINGPTAGVVDTSYTYTFDATDADNDQIRYRIDWDNNGTIDQTVPGSGYTASGTQLPASRLWGPVGTYTFQAHTQDDQGNSSGWQSFTTVISQTSTQCSDGIDNDGDGNVDFPSDSGCISGGDDTEAPNPPTPQCSDGIDNNGNGLIDYPNDPACSSSNDNNEETINADISLSATQTLVQSGGTTVLNWSAQNVRADSCTLSGTNGDSWSLSGASGSQTTGALMGETTYTLTCTNLSDETISATLILKVTPSFEEI